MMMKIRKKSRSRSTREMSGSCYDKDRPSSSETTDCDRVDKNHGSCSNNGPIHDLQPETNSDDVPEAKDGSGDHRHHANDDADEDIEGTAWDNNVQTGILCHIGGGTGAAATAAAASPEIGGGSHIMTAAAAAAAAAAYSEGSAVAGSAAASSTSNAPAHPAASAAAAQDTNRGAILKPQEHHPTGCSCRIKSTTTRLPANHDGDAIDEMSMKSCEYPAAATAAAATSSSSASSAARHYHRSKLPRLRWTPHLHHLFVQVVDLLGGEQKATPKLVLRLMNVEGLTISHIKSHLQMYRSVKYDEVNSIVSANNSIINTVANYTDEAQYHDMESSQTVVSSGADIYGNYYTDCPTHALNVNSGSRGAVRSNSQLDGTARLDDVSQQLQALHHERLIYNDHGHGAHAAVAAAAAHQRLIAGGAAAAGSTSSSLYIQYSRPVDQSAPRGLLRGEESSSAWVMSEATGTAADHSPGGNPVRNSINSAAAAAGTALLQPRPLITKAAESFNNYEGPHTELIQQVMAGSGGGGGSSSGHAVDDYSTAGFMICNRPASQTIRRTSSNVMDASLLHAASPSYRGAALSNDPHLQQGAHALHHYATVTHQLDHEYYCNPPPPPLIPTCMTPTCANPSAAATSLTCNFIKYEAANHEERRTTTTREQHMLPKCKWLQVQDQDLSLAVHPDHHRLSTVALHSNLQQRTHNYLHGPLRQYGCAADHDDGQNAESSETSVGLLTDPPNSPLHDQPYYPTTHDIVDSTLNLSFDQSKCSGSTGTSVARASELALITTNSDNVLHRHVSLELTMSIGQRD